MAIHFKCPACGAGIRASDRKAGSKSRCPKCDEVLSVPVQSPQPGDSDAQEPSSEPPPEQADAATQAKPEEEESLSGESNAAIAASTFPQIIVDGPRKSHPHPPSDPAPKSALPKTTSPKTVWLGAIAVLVAAVLVGGVLLGSYLSDDKEPEESLLSETTTQKPATTSQSPEAPTKPPTKAPTETPTEPPAETPAEVRIATPTEAPATPPEATTGTPGESPSEGTTAPSAVLILDWKEEDREGAAVFIDDIENEVPKSGPMEYTVPIGERRLVLVRPGYKKMERTLICENGKRYRFTTKWGQRSGASADSDAPPLGAASPIPENPGDTAATVAEPKHDAAAKADPAEPPTKAKCKTCRGLEIVPLKPPKPYIHVEGDRVPKPQMAVCCRFCPTCQAERDPKELIEHEIERFKTAGQKHREWERKTGWNLLRIETHSLTIHAQLPPAEAVRVAMALEMMNAHLQQLTGSMALTRSRPDDYEMIVVFGRQNWLQLMKLMEPVAAKRSGKNWELVEEASGWTMDNTTFIRQSPQSATPLAHIAVSQAAMHQIGLATSFSADDWLREGFSAYCENIVMKKNVTLSTTHGQEDVQIGTNWPLEIRRYAAVGKLKPWKEVLHRDLEFFKPIDYLSAFAIVSYLIQTRPAKFVDFVENVGEGLETEAALQKAYGKTVIQLQADWLRWVVR